MIIRGTPKDLNKYVVISSEFMIQKLHENNFSPIYIDGNYVYFEKNEQILSFIEKGGK